MPLVSSFRQLGRVPGEASRVAKHEGVTYVVRVRRNQVESSGGCLIGCPIWAYTRLRWQLRGMRDWSVETTRMRRTGIGGERIASKLFRSRFDAIEYAEAELDRLRDGAAATPDGNSPSP